MYAIVQLISCGRRVCQARLVALMVAGALSAAGCATVVSDEESVSDHRLGSAAKEEETTAASSGFFGRVFEPNNGIDAEQREIAEAAGNDPFPTAAEALGN